MVLWQFDHENGSYLVVVIETDNLDRMASGDPITLEPALIGGMLRLIRHPDNFHLLVAYEKDSGPLYGLMQSGNSREILEYIMRGYKFKDNDGKRNVPGTGGKA